MLDLSYLEEKLVGDTVPRPNVRGTLSGHAAGEPFSELVLDVLTELHGGVIQKQHDYLNQLMHENPEMQGAKRVEKFPLRALGELMWHGRRGKKWNRDVLFNERQSDFADILDLSEPECIHIIDVKTRNAAKKGQPPNIMSALRLARLCKGILDWHEEGRIRITYVGIDWEDRGDRLECVGCHVTELMQIPPQDLYINFTAALQIQFHLDQVEQSFQYSAREWCENYLRHYTSSYDKRAIRFEQINVYPFRLD